MIILALFPCSEYALGLPDSRETPQKFSIETWFIVLYFYFTSLKRLFSEILHKQGCILFNELWFFPPPSFHIWFFSPYLYYISLNGLYLIVILWHSIFGVLWPMGANGGIDKHRQNEIKMKENWRKCNFEGNLNALNFDQNQEKSRKNHFGKWKHRFSRITHGNFSLLFPLPFHFFYSSLIFFPSPKTLWLFSPTPGGGGGGL
jgi:hypothetical protein